MHVYTLVLYQNNTVFSPFCNKGSSPANMVPQFSYLGQGGEVCVGGGEATTPSLLVLCVLRYTLFGSACLLGAYGAAGASSLAPRP